MKYSDKKYVPTLEEAKAILEEGSRLNPGTWIENSLSVGKAAEIIAKEDIEILFN